MDRANLWCRRINWNKNWGRRRSFPLNTEKQRDRGWAVYVAQVSWLLLINPPAPRICPIWAPNGGAALIFCPLFSGHFRPIFEPRCPRVPCYPPVDRSPHFGRTPATSELGLDWASFPRVGLRPDIGFSNIPAQMICPKICSRKSALKSASLAPLANPLHQARCNRSQSHHTRFLFILIIGLNFKIISLSKNHIPIFQFAYHPLIFVTYPYHPHIIFTSS